MFCEVCREIVVPRGPRRPRRCECGRHSVWWEDPERGILRVLDHQGIGPKQPAAYVLAIHQRMLKQTEDVTTPPTVWLCIAGERVPEGRTGALFSKVGSPIVKIRPGMSVDTAWADELPAEEPFILISSDGASA